MEVVSDFLKTLRDANQSGVDFLLVDLDVAMTFLDVAQASSNQETAIRNHHNAHTAYDTTLHLLKKLRPDAEQQQAIDAKLALLKTRLQAVGYQL
jgi:hypothetical protein